MNGQVSFWWLFWQACMLSFALMCVVVPVVALCVWLLE